ncbi:MAG TPA: TPM domain-containing protein, partial [Candidatus Xenobia bacterium]
MKKVIVGLCLMSALMGVALANCDDPIEDGAHILGNDVARVTQAVDDLKRVGGDVRVRTVASLGSAATIDALEASMEKACPSWQTPDGKRRNTLVVVVVALQEHKVGIFYGSQFRSVLDSQFLRIQTQLMGPKFRDKDYAGGIVAGLEETAHLIGASQVAPPTPEPPPKPVDLSGLWKVLGLAVVLGAAGVGLFALSRARASSHADADRRHAAQQQAKIAQQKAANLVVKIEGAPDGPEAHVKDLMGKAPDQDVLALQGRIRTVREA